MFTLLSALRDQAARRYVASLIANDDVVTTTLRDYKNTRDVDDHSVVCDVLEALIRVTSTWPEEENLTTHDIAAWQDELRFTHASALVHHDLAPELYRRATRIERAVILLERQRMAEAAFYAARAASRRMEYLSDHPPTTADTTESP